MSNSNETLIIRPKNIFIGKSSNDYYVWKGIKSIKWNDISPWVHIDIPGGLMVHQHIRSPHVEGEIKCVDLTSMYTALFNVNIDSYNHKAIDTSSFYTKWTVDYLIIVLMDDNNNEVKYKIDNFKVETLGVDNIELGRETEWIVRFTADRIYKV